jgi:hypothetical protein
MMRIRGYCAFLDDRSVGRKRRDGINNLWFKDRWCAGLDVDGDEGFKAWNVPLNPNLLLLRVLAGGLGPAEAWSTSYAETHTYREAEELREAELA